MGRTATGKVLKSIRGHFWVEASLDVYHCSARETLIKSARKTTPIAVGDEVEFQVLAGEEKEGLIVRVRPRWTKLSRKGQIGPFDTNGYEDVVAANVDQVVIVSSVKKPPLRPGLIDRYLVAASKGGLAPIICINKIDLAEPESIEPTVTMYRSLGYRVILTNAKSGQGVDELRSLLRERTSVFAGHSGVGKTTLLCRLCPGMEVKTREVSDKTGRGKHTTPVAQLVRLPSGGHVIDTPGIRYFGLWDLTPRDIQDSFVEIAPHSDACRFRDCSHIVEPDCQVREALDQGAIHPLRFESFLKLRQECKDSAQC